ncbi:hypothetical protein OHA72_20915 [Dactylosporangium sp. NBC_01737]|uniref:hypothetical protein n=1 Tax=Dactylosporangium sp. NBC_01737 TaxID=2975959 RepID=UPI002E12F5D4|nr:hypothetical protein OHA72_20915 [Dactylosporangium sp. NBC_01737]
MLRFLLFLAPAVLAVATAVDPALGEDQGVGIYRAHPDAIQWHSVLLHWSWVLFAPAFLGLLAPVRRRGAVLARITWCAIVFGLVTFSALMAYDLALLAMEQTLPDADVTRVDEAFQSMQWAAWGWQTPGLAGWALALILTPVTAAYAKVISWWTAGAALLGTVLYLQFAISPLPVNLAGPVVMLVAYGFAGWEVGRFSAPAEPDRFGAFKDTAGRAGLVAAPVVFGAGLLTVPGLSPDIAEAVRHPGLAQASAFLLHLSWLLFVPGMLLLMRRGRRFTAVAAGVTAFALMHFSGLMVGDYSDLAVRLTVPAELATKVSDAFGGYALFTFGWAVPAMVLSLLGLIAVPIGAAADGLVRWWVPVLTGLGVVAFLAVGVGPLSVLSPLLLLAGYGLLAKALPPRDPAPAPVTAEEPVAA